MRSVEGEQWTLHVVAYAGAGYMHKGSVHNLLNIELSGNKKKSGALLRFFEVWLQVFKSK